MQACKSTTAGTGQPLPAQALKSTACSRHQEQRHAAKPVSSPAKLSRVPHLVEVSDPGKPIHPSQGVRAPVSQFSPSVFPPEEQGRRRKVFLRPKKTFHHNHAFILVTVMVPEAPSFLGIEEGVPFLVLVSPKVKPKGKM